MKFMVNFSIEQDMWLTVLEKWSSMTPAERADAGPGVKIVGRWHAMGSRTGVVIVESTDLAALTRYVAQWNPFMEMNVEPVLDDEESAALAADIVKEHGE